LQKKIIIVFLGLIIIAGCSVKRKALPTVPGSNFTGTLKVSDVTKLNFTAQSFFIQRADLNIVGNNESQSVTLTIKFAQPDSFLISVRAFLGIEVARILLTNDTVFINDRFNQTLYFGSNKNLITKYGFDLMFFPVLLGDLITAQQTFTGTNCSDGTTVLREFKQNYIINYFIDCGAKKCKEVTVENELMRDYISIKFDEFSNDGNMIFPRHIRINNFANFAILEMNIDRVEFGAGSGIEFIPGRNFDKIEIK
jgi:hypothetical protein